MIFASKEGSISPFISERRASKLSYHTDQGMVAQASQGHCRPQDPIINDSWGFAIHYFILGFSFLRIISCFLWHTSHF